MSSDTTESLMADKRLRMVEHQLRARGISDPRILQVMATVPRHLFVAPSFAHRAYDDCALPSLVGQTISQPFIVAAMTEALALHPDHRILELGTGTGYQTAILSALVPHGEVFTVERIPELTRFAQNMFDSLHLPNIHARSGDGTSGWPADRWPHPLPIQFDRILITASAPHPPQPLLDQLADPGILLLPLGTRAEQTLTRIERQGSTVTQTPLLDCRFVPLLGQYAWAP